MPWGIKLAPLYLVQQHGALSDEAAIWGPCTINGRRVTFEQESNADVFCDTMTADEDGELVFRKEWIDEF